MPKWWSWLFVITVVFALVYLALYPGLGKFPGVLGWTSVGQYSAERERMDATVQPMYSKVPGHGRQGAGCRQAGHGDRQAPVPDLLHAVSRCGRTRCQGFPNLTDSDWLYGGEPEQIMQTISRRSHGRHAAARRNLVPETIRSGELCPLALRAAK